MRAKMSNVLMAGMRSVEKSDGQTTLDEGFYFLPMNMAYWPLYRVVAGK